MGKTACRPGNEKKDRGKLQSGQGINLRAGQKQKTDNKQKSEAQEMTILDQIAEYARARVEADKEKIGPEEMKELAYEAVRRTEAAIRSENDRQQRLENDRQQRLENDRLIRSKGDRKVNRSFYNEIAKPGLSFICEVKKASPSKGVIDPVFDYANIAAEYENAGADCVSCLTEPKWFLGSDEIFRKIRGIIDIPMIRKDFTVDEYQIYQAKVIGADCILLICSLLDTDTIARYLEICESLKLDALVETHDEAEIRSAAAAGARMIGVNNRNLKDFSVDFKNAERLRDLIPSGCLYVAESGVSNPEDAALLRRIGADAVLMGEVLMRSRNKKELLAQMRKAAQDGGAI